MARKPEVLAAAPTLPAASVNFNAMHDAIANGATSQDAVNAGLGATGAAKTETVTPSADDGDDA